MLHGRKGIIPEVQGSFQKRSNGMPVVCRSRLGVIELQDGVRGQADTCRQGIGGERLRKYKKKIFKGSGGRIAGIADIIRNPVFKHQHTDSRLQGAQGNFCCCLLLDGRTYGQKGKNQITERFL